MTTLPSELRLLLIAFASVTRAPSFPPLFSRSLPAKSTKCKRPGQSHTCTCSQLIHMYTYTCAHIRISTSLHAAQTRGTKCKLFARSHACTCMHFKKLAYCSNKRDQVQAACTITCVHMYACQQACMLLKQKGPSASGLHDYMRAHVRISTSLHAAQTRGTKCKRLARSHACTCSHINKLACCSNKRDQVQAACTITCVHMYTFQKACMLLEQEGQSASGLHDHVRAHVRNSFTCTYTHMHYLHDNKPTSLHAAQTRGIKCKQSASSLHTCAHARITATLHVAK